MENLAEMDLDFAVRLYEMVKSDLHTLLVDKSKNKLDYLGEFNMIGGKVIKLATIKYTLCNPTEMNYRELLKLCCFTINKMLKRDMKLWNVVNKVDEFYGFSPKVDSVVNFELSLNLKSDSESE